MIVVDSSALVAILLGEPEKELFKEILLASDRSVISAVNAHETATVLRLRHGATAVDKFWQFLEVTGIEIIPFDAAQVRAAAAAFSLYGKGIHAKARLNLADCAAYALARTLNAPLLFKGNDFTHTDLQACV
ncbi:MAG: type II toxin-antitoxin system VapC family toxin [Acetobacteraceae bacterium]